MVRAAALILALVLASASPAAADWQFTKWGMTPAQVAAAGGSRIVPIVETAPRWQLTMPGPYKVAGLTFDDVTFAFDDGRLSEIELSAPSDSLGKVQQALASALGPPAYSRFGGEVQIYRDPAKGNSIKLRVMGPTIFLNYTPLRDGF